jgi:hypothetical protein
MLNTRTTTNFMDFLPELRRLKTGQLWSDHCFPGHLREVKFQKIYNKKLATLI